MNIIFISWGREVEKSNFLARGLGAYFKQIYIKKVGGVKLPAIFRYIIQGGKTLIVLFEERPKVVIVQNPPVFAPLTVWLYCIIFGAKLALDSHSAAFLDKKWVFFYPLFKFVARRADLNSCHNYRNLEILQKWQIKPLMVMQNYNPKYDIKKLTQPMENGKIDRVIRDARMPIMMVNKFANDDDWRTVIETARLMPEVTFFITGDDTMRKAKAIKKISPVNVYFTGYLNHDEFMRLMWRCRIILAFTLRKDTVLWSIREIMALEKPFITTDSEVLRHYFSEVALFAKPDTNELKKKIKLAIRNEDQIKNNIKNFLKKDRQRWNREIREMKKYLGIKE